MSALDPPAILAAGTYKKGDLIGLGKTPSWYYPYIMVTVDTWVCVGTTYEGKLYLTQPTTAVAEFFWPQWHPGVDYSTEEWLTGQFSGTWKVGYNGLYYETTIWITSSHVGKSPVDAVADVGARINKKFQNYKDEKQNDVCTNQSHPIRAWRLVGSLEVDPEINTAGNPYGGEDARVFEPRSFKQYVSDPSKAGGDSYGSHVEEYYPQMMQPIVWVADTSRTKFPSYVDPASKYLKVFDTQADYSNPEPTSWDIYSGKMATKDIMSTSGYMLSDYFWYYQGISINLWQQKVTRRDARTKKTLALTNSYGLPAGTSTYYLNLTDNTVAETPMPADDTMIVCTNPGPGFSIGYNDYPSIDSRAQTYVPPTSTGNSYSASGKFDLYMTTRHPLFFTRPAIYFEQSYTFTSTNAKFPTGGTYNGQPAYAWYETSRDYKYTYSPKELTPSYDQLSMGVYSTDKQNKRYYENASHTLGTLTWSIQSSYSQSGSKTTEKNSSYGVPTAGRWKPD